MIDNVLIRAQGIKHISKTETILRLFCMSCGSSFPDRHQVKHKT